jgi:hypothetical protein
MRNTRMTAGLVLGMAALALLVSGCKQDQPKRKYIEPVEGTALDINTETGEVAMEFVHPESGTAVVRKGFINENTQVQVNGVTARIEDLHKGDTVKVTGYQEGPRDSRKFYVTSINVRRSDNNWLDTAGGASSAPASRPAGGIESMGAHGSKLPVDMAPPGAPQAK